ncbi:uncharacterized protein LOC110021162 [Phalaenopsis equestris]|uniref:uncharacterized protein LOC110021162 n=1 Tax=Phalaenopsis equestris TaxID=78828 RepID=UPI0009E35CFD|nr:uncharacterized protein LOC110021162 [Phalaenopsis equestris]
MDPFKRSNPLNSQTNLNRSELKRRKDSCTSVAETDENEFSFHHNEAPTKSRDLKAEQKKIALFSNTPSSFKKKILAERKEDLLLDSSQRSYLEGTPQSNKCMQCVHPRGASFHNSPISLHSYDPFTNYTSPRPKFLRYNPNRRRELLKRIKGERRENEGAHSASSISSLDSSSTRENENEHEEEEELKEKPFYSCVVWSLIPIFVVLLFISYCMISGYPSIGGYESPAANIQKIQGGTPLRLEGKDLFSKNLLGRFMSLSEMCPIVEESLCYLDKNLSVSLEIDGVIRRERAGKEKSLSERIRSELSTEVNHLLLKQGGLVDDGSVDKEKMDLGQNLMDFGTLTEEIKANKYISSVETLKENKLSSSSVESSLVSVVQHVSDSLSTIKEDKFQNPSLDSIELSTISHSALEESTSLNDHGLHNFNFSAACDTELKSDYSSSILSEEALRIFSIFIGLLIIVVGLLCSFHKYFRSQKLNSLHVFSSPPSSEFCLKSETEKNTVTNFPMKEEDVDFGRPRVKLLGEFSPFDARFTNNGSGSNFKKMEQPNSRFSYYQKGIGRKISSSLPDMLDSSPEKSNSSRFSSKVPTDKGELSNSSATSSLRRSSRLQNRKQVICS